jgi:hypothetical protein
MLSIIYFVQNLYVINISAKKDEFRQMNLIIKTRSMFYVL